MHERSVVPVSEGAQEQPVRFLGPRNAVRVACLVEARERVVEERARLGRAHRAVEQARPHQLDLRPQLDPSVPEGARSLDHLLENADRHRVLAQRLVDLAQAALQLESLGIGRGQELDRTIEQHPSGARIEAPQRARARATETHRGGTRQRRMLAACLALIERRLLEVVADDLVERAALIQPARKSFVELSPLGLGDGGIRCVSDQGMVEEERVVRRTLRVGSYEAPSDERQQRGRRPGRLVRRRARRPRRA